jgi:fibronectin type 3 domain-containing protein
MKLWMFLFVAALPALAQHQIVLNWQAPATGDAPAAYSINRSTTSGTEVLITTIPATATTYTDVSSAGNLLTPGVTYYYTVIASNAQGSGPASNEVAVKIPFLAPGAPQGLTGTAK